MFDPMTRLLLAIGITGVLAILGAAQPAANAEVPAGDTPQAPAEYEIVTGEVAGIDPQARTFELVISSRDQPTAIAINDQTRFLFNGELSDQSTVLRTGTQVAVRHVDGTALVVSHRVLESPQ